VLQSALERLVTEGGALGATAAVRCDGLGAWAGAAGFRDLAASVPITPEACMPTYSVTKTITAICIARLSDTETLSLEDPISKWISGLPFGEIVSLRHLLNHTSGVPNYSLIQEQRDALLDSPGRAWSFEQFVEATCHRGLEFEPGTGCAYSNTGYMLLKRVIESANGTSFATAVAAHVGGPLGFSSTSAIENSYRLCAPGFSRRFGSGRPPEDVRAILDPGWCATGVVASTSAELCELLQALFGGKLVVAESLAQMTDLWRAPDGHPPSVAPGYGLGLIGDPGGVFGPEFGHGGAGPGYDVHVTHFPQMSERRVSIAVMCNTDETQAQPILRGLACELDGQLGETFILN